ncbi:MAG: hypothetical protein ISR82_03140 [Candidatus Marinimicrobia bacterium]|nr:hypothetical protein [Candidatus Neomarinimicrobiota bacterium]MBL7010197.1 hypothetical protein [Candidatus Neomarinimicrobiota bacterium]MBL7030610.1 hypothetical protein [Candidatus Neomarinimicrobiota bacterium]
MIKQTIKKWVLPILLLAFIGSCDRDGKCNSCGDLLGGFIYMKVTASDLAKYEGLAALDGIDVGACIRAYILEEELNVNTVSIVDDCCCEF